MTSIDNLTKEIMKGLQEYSELADDEMKKAVRKTATSVKKEISANAPHNTGTYAKSWTSSKVKETSHNLQMTVHSRNRYRLAHLLEKGHANVAEVVFLANHTLNQPRKTEKFYLKISSERKSHDLRRI